jgi:hypothetical protein
LSEVTKTFMGYTMSNSNIRVPVVDPEGKPLMPTTPSRVRRWMEQSKAIPKWSDLGVFYVQLINPPSGYETQSINIGIDPGKGYSLRYVSAQMDSLAA